LLGLEFVDVEELVGAAIRANLLPGTWYVDVGAHRGRHLWSALAMPEIRALAVEADADSAYALNSEILARGAAGRALVVNVAASDLEVRAVPFFRHRTDSGYSGLRERTIPGLPRDYESAVVPASSLDKLLESCGPVSVIKIDVEGAELPVLRGAARRIQQDQPVVLFECAVDGAAYFGYDLGDIGRLVSEWGYQLAAITGQRLVSDRECQDAFYQRLCYEFCAAPDARAATVFSRLTADWRSLIGGRP
jgi:FkbM family methyltransferase